MKPLVIYHADCTDGFGAAFVAWLKLGDEAEYLPMAYGESANQWVRKTFWSDEVVSTLDGREIYILDFSFAKDAMDYIFANAKRVVWLDHHASVMKEWGEGSVPASVEVRLSNGRLAYVDPDDYEKVKGFSWSEHVKGGAVAYDPSTSTNKYMHHMLLPQKEGFVVDHINRNSLDNRKCNLRYATRSQNGANGVWNEARYKGVTQHGRGFKAQITVNYENIVVGTYPTEEEAARAYDEAARKQWGVFARTNFDQREPFPPNACVVLDNNKSGALLAWEYFHPGVEVPLLIKHIDDRDRWQFKLGGSKELHAALQSYRPWSFEQWRTQFLLADMGKTGLSFEQTARYSYLMEEGATILRAKDQQVESMAKQATKCALNTTPISGAGLPGLACNASLHHSELGHVLATKSGTYGMIWYVAQDNKVKCSLRSNGDYDVSAIAKVFGGGGHRNAAGFETDIDTLMGWIK